MDDPFFPDFPGIEDPGMDDPGIEDPGIENPEDPGTENPEDPGIENPEDPDQEPTPTPEPSYDDAVVYDGTDNPLKGDAKAYKGTGEQSDPLVFLCQPGTVITGEFFIQTKLRKMGRKEERVSGSVWRSGRGTKLLESCRRYGNRTDL